MPGNRAGGAGASAQVNELPTTVVEQYNANVDPRVQLWVLEPSGLSVFPLPEAGTVTIGRAEECEVKLKDPLASRRHASLCLEPLSIEDHGSANGTVLGNCRIAQGKPVQIEIGQAIGIGSTLLILRRGVKTSAGSGEQRRGAPGSGLARRVTRQPVMHELYARAERLAMGSINVLIVGETGVGKEVVAEEIHRASPRGDGPLVRINCAALTEPLLESELFGHERGAFTGAIAAKPGLIEVAHGGTIFLDEVGELPPALQAKLLRVLEAREVTRVGGVQPRSVDVRFLAATNRNLDDRVKHGSFRADLLFRLNGALLEVPPLRERPLEIMALANEFAELSARQLNLPAPPKFAEDAGNALLEYAWPGNVRELRNAVERAVLLCSGPTLRATDLTLHQPASAEPRTNDAKPETVVPDGTNPIEDERRRIIRALSACGGNQTRAAESLGMSRRTLVRRIAELNLPRPHHPRK
jgi:DNA-binding NtrC family response regulator